MQFTIDGALERPEEVLDYLTYCNYRANRGYGMTQSGYERCLGRSCEDFERRYQEELNNGLSDLEKYGTDTNSEHDAKISGGE